MGELAGLESGADEASAAAIEADGTALGLALERARSRGGKGDDAADRLLAAQEALIADQRLHLREEFRHLGLRVWSERLKLAVQAMTIGVGVIVLGVVAAMAWDAHEADGVVIKPFSVPPDLAQRGVTGEAVASQLLDRLTDITETGHIGAPTAKVEAGWGHNISIEIPETGISLAQLDQWLRDRLGRQQPLTGEVVRQPDGALVLDARLNGHPLPSQTGAADQFSPMVTRLAEAIYAREQPMGFADYLLQMRRLDEMAAHARAMTGSRDPVVRAYGWGSLGVVAQEQGDEAAATRFYHTADEAGLSWPAGNLAELSWRHGREEASFRYMARELPLLAKDRSNNSQAVGETRLDVEAYRAQYLRDHATALAKRVAESQGENLGRANSPASLQVLVAYDRALAHEGGRAEATTLEFEPQWPADKAVKAEMLWRIAYAREDWANMLQRLEAYEAVPGVGAQLVLEAHKALALTKLGRLDEARALMAASPADCQTCLRVRATIAEAAGRRPEADGLYADAARMAPSLPSANLEWGRTLLARGDAARAALQFREALRRSPRAEEALEGLGEALAAQNDAAGAVKQYAAANALTPKWGRLHLKWGEALAKLGDVAGAKAQFAQATNLDLSADERAELARQKS